MRLEVGLQVEVGDGVLVGDLEQLAEGSIGEDAALVGRVEAVVLLDVGGDELGDLGLGALGSGSDAHKGAEFSGETARLKKCVVRTTRLPRLLLLGGHLLRALGPLALLGVLDLALGNLDRGKEILGNLLEFSRERGLDAAEALGNRLEALIGGGGGLGGSGNLGGSDGRDNRLDLGGRGSGRLLRAHLLLSGGGGRSRGSNRGGSRLSNNLLGDDLLGLGITGGHVC